MALTRGQFLLSLQPVWDVLRTYRDTIQRAGSARMTLSRLRADVTSRLAYEEIFENVVVLSWRQ